LGTAQVSVDTVAVYYPRSELFKPGIFICKMPDNESTAIPVPLPRGKMAACIMTSGKTLVAGNAPRVTAPFNYIDQAVYEVRRDGTCKGAVTGTEYVPEPPAKNDVWIMKPDSLGDMEQQKVLFKSLL